MTTTVETIINATSNQTSEIIEEIIEEIIIPTNKSLPSKNITRINQTKPVNITTIV